MMMMMMTMILCLLSPRSWWLLLLFFCSCPSQTPIASLQKKIKKIMLQGISRKSFQFHQVKEFSPKSTLFSSQRAVMTTANKPLTQSPIWSRLGSLSTWVSYTPPPLPLVFNIHKPTNTDSDFSLFLFNAIHSVLLVAKSRESPRPMGKSMGIISKTTLSTQWGQSLCLYSKHISHP